MDFEGTELLQAVVCYWVGDRMVFVHNSNLYYFLFTDFRVSTDGVKRQELNLLMMKLDICYYISKTGGMKINGITPNTNTNNRIRCGFEFKYGIKRHDCTSYLIWHRIGL